MGLEKIEEIRAGIKRLKEERELNIKDALKSLSEFKVGYDNLIKENGENYCAENIYRAINELGFCGNATLFIGYNHINGLSTYIHDPEMRKKKRKLYFLQELFTQNKILMYKNESDRLRIVARI